MYNRTPYNRTAYNRKKGSVFEWLAVATAETESSGAILIIRYFEGEAEAVAESSGVVVRTVLLESTVAEATALAFADYIRRVFLSGEAEAVAESSGGSLSTLGQEILILEGLNMKSGDELKIDTEHMTITLNGVNIIDRVKDESVFFKLKSGINDIVIEGGSRADIKILWKDRWL